MIGLDRPLRPEWIFKTLQMVEPGNKGTTYNEPFEDIAKELIGKEGKRKVRTVIFRSFFYSFQKRKGVIENNIFLDWSKHYSQRELEPLFIIKLLMDYDICRFVIQKLKLIVDATNTFSMPILTKRMVQEFGDRDVVKRSLRSFISSLVHFGLLVESSKNEFHIQDKSRMNDSQIILFIKLYSTYFVKSEVFDLNTIEDEFSYFFDFDNIHSVANMESGKSWEFIRDTSRNMILIKKS